MTKLLDKRTVERYRHKGEITTEQIDAHKKSLPDEAANADYISMEYFETDFADDGDDAHRHHESEEHSDGEEDSLAEDEAIDGEGDAT